MELLSRPRVWCVLVLGALTLSLASSVDAQLLSPGPLIEAHEELEGALNCTQCHQLRQRGASADRCLACHAPLRARIARGRGYHGQIDASDCGSCHAEHAGRKADIVRFAAASFNHDEAGYTLRGVHAEADCVACHTPTRIVDREVRRQKAAGGTLDRTYLGLAANCRGCHVREDPHGDQFGLESCESCHAESSWPDLEPFDHSATSYPLTGAHAVADCASCHTQGQYRGLPAESCATCHSDPHRRAFGQNCSACHNTGAWSGVSSGRVERSFNHRATGFVLRGAHADADCASCHTPTDPQPERLLVMQWQGESTTGYTPPRVDAGCLSCHSDYHDGDLAEAQDGPDCGGCHTERNWAPSAFDFAMHERTDFPLRGAHQAVVCEACHTTTVATPTAERLVFSLPWSDCASCHVSVDPHRGQFGDRDCASCHGVGEFRIADFDHDRTDFPLDPTHQLECSSCHATEADGSGGFVRYTPLGAQCRDCHS